MDLPNGGERRPRILVVDDEPVFSNQTKYFLEQNGYEVTVARNGRDAVTALDKNRYDLMLLDIIMPMLNGVEVIRALRANPATADLPIIVVSSMTEYKERVEFFRIGATDYMPKPIDKGELLARVGLQLQVIKLRQQVETANSSLVQQNRMLEQHLARLEHDLAVARSVQRSLLPQADKDYEDLSLHYKHLSSENLGSDYFDYIREDDGTLHVIIADVSGHGIASALLAAQLKVVFSSLIPRHLNPKSFVGEVNKLAVRTLTKGYYFTAIYLQYRPAAQEIRAVNAGHTPMVIYSHKGKSATLFESENSPLGFFEQEDYQERSFNVGPGDLAVMFTDGISEHTNSFNEMFEVRRVVENLIEFGGLHPQLVINQLIKAAREFGSTPVFKDDLTLGIVRFGRPLANPLEPTGLL